MAKKDYASGNWYDVWFPNLAPSAALVKRAHKAASEEDWTAFKKSYRAEMASPENSRTLDLLAALSRTSDFSLGCYCENEARCHRAVLRELLKERRAKVE